MSIYIYTPFGQSIIYIYIYNIIYICIYMYKHTYIQSPQLKLALPLVFVTCKLTVLFGPKVWPSSSLPCCILLSLAATDTFIIGTASSCPFVVEKLQKSGTQGSRPGSFCPTHHSPDDRASTNWADMFQRGTPQLRSTSDQSLFSTSSMNLRNPQVMDMWHDGESND